MIGTNLIDIDLRAICANTCIDETDDFYGFFGGGD